MITVEDNGHVRVAGTGGDLLENYVLATAAIFNELAQYVGTVDAKEVMTILAEIGFETKPYEAVDASVLAEALNKLKEKTDDKD